MSDKLPTPQDFASKFQPSTSQLEFEAEIRSLEAARKRWDIIKAGKKLSTPEPLPRLKSPTPIGGSTHLIVGDAHAKPDVENHRFDWLGRLIVDRQPNVIVDIGDWWAMDSLCGYDKKGSRAFEGNRYVKDIEAGIDAQHRVQHQLDDYNRGRRKKYEPRRVRTLGNHDGGRICRLLEEEPRFSAVLGTRDLLSAEFGWEEYPYLAPVEIDGISYCHIFQKGGRERSGKYVVARTTEEESCSLVFGHTHKLAFWRWANSLGRSWQGLNCGCYFLHWEDWGKTDNHFWSRGIAILNNVRDGQFDLEWVGMDEVRRKYS
jgi:hypothetical protein